MKLARDEIARIRAGDLRALKRDDEPDCEAGDTYVLSWSPARRVVVDRETGETADYPRRPLRWIEFEQPVRHRKGGWLVMFKMRDERVETRFLAGGPAPGSLTPETERGYRSTGLREAGAIDNLESVDDEELDRQQAKAEERWAEHRDQVAGEEELRRQERALREQLKQAVRELPIDAGRALLAAVQRELEHASEVTQR